jgi:predicted ATPase
MRATLDWSYGLLSESERIIAGQLGDRFNLLTGDSQDCNASRRLSRSRR